jgi:hypothetical protein
MNPALNPDNESAMQLLKRERDMPESYAMILEIAAMTKATRETYEVCDELVDSMKERSRITALISDAAFAKLQTSNAILAAAEATLASRRARLKKCDFEI